MNPRYITWLFQFIIIIFALYIIYTGQILGLLLLLPTIFVDYLIKSARKDTIGMYVKILLIFQCIVVFVFMSNQLSPNSISNIMDNVDNTLLTRTRNIVPIQPSIVSLEKKVEDIIILPKKILPYKDSIIKQEINIDSVTVIDSIFNGNLLPVNFPDLKYRTSEEVRSQLAKVFTELPTNGFNKNLKNPCWNNDEKLHCLPYSYILGQPKCGTSDLYERLKRHPDIRMPRRKEVRWFTRGEFMTGSMSQENIGETHFNPGEKRLGSASSIYTFTSAFQQLANDISNDLSQKQLITIDGGPHTLWWPTQNSDGSFLSEDIPAPQMVREIQPEAKFLLTISDPVHRMYSDYYFLDDNLRPVKPGQVNSKSAKQFHERVVEQIEGINACINQEISLLISDNIYPSSSDKSVGSALWFRASQICAHDRKRFAKGGWGRISIGLYSVFLEKWFEHFKPSQFYVVCLEEYEKNPTDYMSGVFKFLDLSELNDDEWSKILNIHHANEHHGNRDAILIETEILLRHFYKPYNEILSKLLMNNPIFLWEQEQEGSLHKQQTLQLEHHTNVDEQKNVEHSLKRSKEEAIKERKKKIMFEDFDQHHPMRHANVEENYTTSDLNDKVLEEPNLRGVTSAFMEECVPKKFKIDDLPQSDKFNDWLNDGKIIKKGVPIQSNIDAAQQLCAASFGMDFAALQYLLYDIGIPSTVLDNEDAHRNAFHCISHIALMADGHSKSHVYSLLKGKKSWMSQYIIPNLPQKQHSVLSRDIIDGVSEAVIGVALWLHRAGIDHNLKDDAMCTPLHYACIGGLLSLVKLLLEFGVDDINSLNRDFRTPLHYALAYGHAEVAGYLISHGANQHLLDKNGVEAYEIYSNPGPILPEDCIRYLNHTQRAPRKIDRVIHPEFNTDERGGWHAGDGGWDSKRLQGFEDDMLCEIDQFWADEITGDEIFSNYLARGAPILIRGLFNDWDVINRYTSTNLRSIYGEIRVQVSDIPYAQKYGGAGHTDMLLSEYIDEVFNHKIVGGSHPWYVFKGHPIPKLSDEKHSLVSYDTCPTPEILKTTFRHLYPNLHDLSGEDGIKSREMFVNAQFAVGGEGTGAPVHFHNSAWNALVYGSKKWVIYPPHYAIMSNKQILDYFETDMKYFENRGVKSHFCTQTAGDIVIIPESWGHGVLNIQQSIAIATEVKASIWRVKPSNTVLNKMPNTI